jgi:hypothetical protein
MTSTTTTPGGLEARPPESNGQRTPAEIEADIERTRDRLAGTVDALAERVKPANVVRRAVASVKAEFVDEQGNLRTTRVAALAAVTAAGVGLVLWRRSR